MDTISSLGSLDFRMDEWKIDCVVGGSQKGLMLPTGHELHRRVGRRAWRRTRSAKLTRFYFDWTLMAKRPQKSFIGTLPVNMFYGLRESIRLLEEEGLANVFARHTRLAEATRRAVQVWAGNNGPQLYLHQSEPLFQFGDRGADAGGLRRRSWCATRRAIGSTCRSAAGWASWAARSSASAISAI